MTLEERINEIKDQMLWMADKPGTSITARYDDPYYGGHKYFTALQREDFDKSIEQYANEHPVS